MDSYEKNSFKNFRLASLAFYMYVMRSSNKAILADALWSPELEALLVPTGKVQYVVDGGALLHHIPWTRGYKWELILGQYKVCPRALQQNYSYIQTALHKLFDATKDPILDKDTGLVPVMHARGTSGS